MCRSGLGNVLVLSRRYFDDMSVICVYCLSNVSVFSGVVPQFCFNDVLVMLW